HFKEDASERPDVRTLIDHLAACLLRTHVSGSAQNDSGLSGVERQRRRIRCAGLTRTVHGFRQTEVQHLYRPIRTYFDIRGLEIAMDDSLIVCSFERGGNLFGDE